MNSNKKERRLARHIRNQAKDKTHKIEAWDNGKLIKPNHNGKPYPLPYCIELGQRLVEIIKNYKQQIISTPGTELEPGQDWAKMDDVSRWANLNFRFVKKFRLYRAKFIEFILYYPQEELKTKEYEYIKSALETYWDDQEHLLNLV